MSLEKARAHLAQFGVDNRIRELAQSSATVELAAQALGCEGARIAKTLSLWLKDKPILIVTAGDAKIDNPKYKHFFGAKAKMIAGDEVEAAVGHAPGGVCPFGVNAGVTVYLDVSLKRFETVFPACGSGNSAIQCSVDELEKFCGSVEWIDVCKNWQSPAAD